MQKGDMFFRNPKDKDFIKPEVYVKMENAEVQGRQASIFIKNSALVKICTGNYEPYPSDRWAITDEYYDEMVKDGYAIPISDIKEVEKICPEYKIDL